MDIVKNLICLENDRASVIRLRSDKLEFVKKDGEIDFPITIDFWEWWKRVVSYIDGEPVDICFVYDKNYDLLQANSIAENNVINTEESSWKVEYIKSYFWQLKPTYINLVIVGAEQQEYALGGDKGAISRRFYTNLNFEVSDESNEVEENIENESTETDSIPPIDEGECSDFAKFFIDLIRRERG